MSTYIVGKSYLVTTIFHDAPEIMDYVPVLGKLHTDDELFTASNPNAKIPHIHIDFRFLKPEHLSHWGKEEDYHASYGRFPVVGFLDPKKYGHPEIEMKEMKCIRNFPDYREAHKHSPGYDEIEAKCEKKTLNLKKPVCPHHGTDLSTVQAKDGVITCPLHGLNWCGQTGKLIKKSVRTGIKISKELGESL
jgi:hypothetical protein